MASESNKKVRVWDAPVRLFHWTLVILIATSYFSGRAGDDWMKVHFWSGYGILTLLLFRIAWGFVGSTTARFSNFVRGPVACFAHLRNLVTNRPTYEAGHNPAGGMMVMVLIFAVLAQATAGLFSADTDTGMINGPLATLAPERLVDKATTFHKFWINVILGLVALHVLAALSYLVIKRQNLIGAMFTGHKPLEHVAEAGKPAPTLRFASGGLALSLLILAAALVYFLIIRRG